MKRKLRRTALLLCAALTLSMLTFHVSAQTPEGAPAAEAYCGEGMVIALLGTGFMTDHESFLLTTGRAKLTREAVDALTARLSPIGEGFAESYYVSEKIPFARSYVDGGADVSGYDSHGTLMLSAAAGNNAVDPYHPDGTAPEAQVLAMKVFTNDGRTDASMISAAIDDALTLGADVICLPFGSECGFDNGSEDGLSLNEAVIRAKERGVTVICAAGDAGKLGAGTIYDTFYGVARPTTDCPDSGTISYPGCIPEALCVGSADDNIVRAPCLTLDDGTAIPYADSNTLIGTVTGGRPFAEFFGGQTLAFETVGGFGAEKDFAGRDLIGKLAVIERGTLTFVEKANNAKAAGAVGVIVTDNQPDPNETLTVRPDLTGAEIPLILVPADARKLLENDPSKKVCADPTVVYEMKTSETPLPSSSSSRGPTPGLALKPDLTVISSSVECARADDTDKTRYAGVSGSEAAAARAAGMYVCVKEKLLETTAGLSETELAALCEALLMSSAGLMTEKDGSAISPRTQGAGCASAESALDAGLLLTSGGKGKIECGACGGWLAFPVTAVNLTDRTLSCTLDAVVGTDGYESFAYAELETDPDAPLYEKLGRAADDTVSFIRSFTPIAEADVYVGDWFCELNTAAEDYSPCTFTLEAGESRTFDVSVHLPQTLIEARREVFPNGFFLEGFLRVTAEEETASLPFLGFVGDFSDGEALDRTVYDGIPALYMTGRLFCNPVNNLWNGRLTLGEDPYGGSSADASALCFSPTASREEDGVYLRLCFLRGVTDLTVRVSDEAGDLLSEQNLGSYARTHISQSTGMPTWADIPVFTGRADDNPNYVYPDGFYTVAVSCRTGLSDRLNPLEYRIRVDTAKPEITENGLTLWEGYPAYRLTVRDDSGVSQVTLMDSMGEYAPLIAENGGEYLFALAGLSGRYLYAEITDRALNYDVVRLDNPSSDGSV